MEAALERIDVESMELIVAEKIDAVSVFQGNGMGALIESIESLVDSVVPDITTDRGRKDIISLAHKVSKSKTLIVDKGVAVTADWKAKTKVVNDNIKIAKTRLDALRDKTRKPVTDWEVAEVETLCIETDRRRDALKEYNVVLPELQLSTMTWEEFENALFTAKEDWEEAKRIRDEQEEKRKAEAKRLADQKIDQDRKAAKLKAESDKIEEERKTLAATRKTLDAEKKRLADAEAKKQAEEEAKGEAVERGFSIPHVSVGGNHEAAERQSADAERQERLAPDKVDVKTFLETFRGGYCPTREPESSSIVEAFTAEKNTLIDSYLERLEAL